jgi:O-antigen ligase
MMRKVFREMPLQIIHAGHVLGIAALLVPTVAVFALFLVTPIMVITLIGLIALQVFGHSGGSHSDRPLVFTVAIILAWSALSLFWTIDAEDAFVKYVSVAGFGFLATAGLVFAPAFSEHERHALRRFILAGIAIGFIAVFFEMATTGAIGNIILSETRYGKQGDLSLSDPSSLLFLFVWPAAAILWRSWPLIATGVVGGALVSSYFIPGASASIGLTIGTVFFFASLLASRGAMIFLAAAVTLGILAAPFAPRLAPEFNPAAIRAGSNSGDGAYLHRMDVWDFTIRNIEERPWAGWGFNASSKFPGGNARYDVRDRSGKNVGQASRLPQHPHNGALQVWLELGFPGALGFAALFGLAALRTARQADPAGAAAALALIATAVPMWFLSFGIWQIGGISVLLLTSLLFAALAVSPRA